jgi:thiol:disulfide interchange protein
MTMLHSQRRAFLIILLLLFLLPIGTFCQSVRSGHVEATLAAEQESIQPGTVFTVTLRLLMDQGWYVYGKNPSDFGLPTTLVWDLPEGFSAEEPQWPAEASIETQGVVSHGYAERLILPVRITAPAGLRNGDAVTLRARAGWLACKVECMPGEAELSLSLPVRSRSEASRGIAGLLAAIGLAFIGGLILNLMPCVLPVISLKVLSLVRQSTERGRRGGHDGVLYTIGVLFSFWIIAAVLLLLRNGGRLLGWGFQLQSAGVIVAAAMLFFLIGLNLFGVFEIGVSLTRCAGGPVGRAAGLGSFLSGMLATVVATPCTAPFMGVAIGYALAHSASEALLVFTSLGLGMALPMLVLSAFPRLLGHLPKPGPWMQGLRQVMGFLMMAAVIWMLYVLAGLSDAKTVILVLVALLAAGLGAWIWGRWGGLERAVHVRGMAGLLALILIAGAAGIAMGRLRRAPAPAASVASAAEISDPFWTPWSPQGMERLLGQGAPVFIDFTARWCLSCQVNETVALNDAGVRKRFEELGITALKADWTDRDEAIAGALAGFGRASVPLYVYYPRGSREPRILPELLTPGIVMKALEREK